MNEQRNHRITRTGWRALAGLACLPILALGASGLASEPVQTAEAAAPAAPPADQADDHMLCSGATAGEVDVHILEELDADRGLRLSLDITNHTGDEKEISYAVEVRRVNGSAQSKPVLAAPRRFRGGERAASLPIATPAGLPDGYYRVLVTALATGDGGYEHTTTREIYIRSANGAPRVISHDEWYERSGIQRHGRQG